MADGAAPFDLDAYLNRLGLSGRPGLAEIHRAHLDAIPFENLDPHRGVPVSLALDDLQRKLVLDRRGGYCFEHNLLLKAALEALGADVDLLLARVRLGASPAAVRPRSHLVLRVRADGAVWQADVGFGSGTPLEPLEFGSEGVRDISGWKFRIVREDDEYVLQTIADGTWTDMYGFVPKPVPLVDVETSNWYTSTHPHSPFVTGLIAARHRPNGSRVSLSDWTGLALTEQTPDHREVTPDQLDEVPGLLAEHFGLLRFAIGERGRVIGPESR